MLGNLTHKALPSSNLPPTLSSGTIYGARTRISCFIVSHLLQLSFLAAIVFSNTDDIVTWNSIRISNKKSSSDLVAGNFSRWIKHCFVRWLMRSTQYALQHEIIWKIQSDSIDDFVLFLINCFLVFIVWSLCIRLRIALHDSCSTKARCLSDTFCLND